MDYRCPACARDLGRRRWTGAVVARMEIECGHCHKVIRLNVHPAEVVLAVAVFGAILVLAALGYRFRSHALMLAFLGVAMLGALAMPVLERVILRAWPRYASK